MTRSVCTWTESVPRRGPVPSSFTHKFQDGKLDTATSPCVGPPSSKRGDVSQAPEVNRRPNGRRRTVQGLNLLLPSLGQVSCKMRELCVVKERSSLVDGRLRCKWSTVYARPEVCASSETLGLSLNSCRHTALSYTDLHDRTTGLSRS